MSGPRDPGDLPADLPPEYAEAYRRGYERALGDEPGPKHAARTDQDAGQGEPTRAARKDRGGRPAWIVAAVLAAMAVLLVVAAYGVGRIFSAGVGEVDTGTEQPDGVNLGNSSGSADPSPSESGKPSQGATSEQPDQNKKNKPYAGPVDSVEVGGSKASCRSDSSVDAAGRPVRYPSTNAHDGDLTTAWRCDGGGAGQTLRLRLPNRVVVGEVGLVPGYAKTDPANGVDRYAENNRLTKVRWRFPDGSTYVQTMNGDENDRSMRRMRIPRTTADSVVVEIVSSARGPRNTVAVSEVVVGAARN